MLFCAASVFADKQGMQEATVQNLESERLDIPVFFDEFFITDAEVDPVSLSKTMLQPGTVKGKEMLPGAWKRIPAPANAASAEFFGLKESLTIWYYKSFIAPSEIRAGVSLKLGRVSDRDRIYFNGVLIGQTGVFNSRFAQASDKRRMYEIPPGLILPGAKNIILLQVQNYVTTDFGLNRDRVEFGYTATLAKRNVLPDLVGLIFLAAVLALFGLTLWKSVRSGDRRDLAILSAFIAAVFVYGLMQSQFKFELTRNFAVLKKFEYLARTALLPLSLLLLLGFFRKEGSRLAQIRTYAISALVVLCTVVCGLVIFSSDLRFYGRWFDWTVTRAALPLSGALMAFLIIRQISLKKAGGALALTSLLLLILANAFDVLVHQGVIRSLVPEIAVTPLLLLAAIPGLVFHSRLTEPQKQRVAGPQGEKPVARSLDRRYTPAQLEILKFQREQEYELTAHLLEQLGTNSVKSDFIKVESLLKEKQGLISKRSVPEAGGDLIIAHSLMFQDRPFCAVLNADTKRKSAQGAGGVLVIATIFASIMERTRFSADLSRHYPEQWLKYSYLELNKVLEGFQGSTQTTLFLCIIDELAGVMYSINAGHPQTILYRNSKAEFIENEISLPKPGLKGPVGEVQVRTQYLMSGDVIVTGSAAKDRLILGVDDEGQRIYNEDESQILGLVEATQADLGNIYDSLAKRGEFSSDVSLVKIAYQAPVGRVEPDRNENTSEGLQNIRGLILSQKYEQAIAELELIGAERSTNPHLVYQLVRANFHLKHFERGTAIAEDFVTKFPLEEEFLYLTAFGHKMSGNLEKSVDFGERHYIRNPASVKNIINLIDAHVLLGNLNRGHELFAKAFRLDPYNDKLARLQEALLRRGILKERLSIA